ncbi:MAG: alpha/beta hydrolase [Planctomycetaceae bacterium]|nr:alpha/beta hydrolase [Planctomycetaceae bacterium]MBT6919061.1 alpha/beta hydrolase [Planctomycetaceae bacterium]
MKKRFCFVAILAVSCLSCAMYFVKADTFAEKILRSFPQADRNSDGVLSEEEEAFVSQRVMQRYPQADQDGDGVLSETEKQELVQKASQRGRKQRPSSASRSGTNSQNAEAVLKQLGLKGELDIEYRKNTTQQRNRLDFIYPKTKVYERAPLFIYIHGGGNTGGTKNALYNRSSLILKELTESGIAVATIDYRVFGAGEELGFHQLFEDCKDALRFLAKHSDRYGVDPHKFITWGTSAGGSKALVAALTDSDFLPGENAGPETEHTVIGAISFYGATTYLVPELWEKRLERFPGRSESKGAMMFKPSHGMSTEEIAKLVSADQYLKADSPPVLLVHGDTDPVVPIDLSTHLYTMAKEKGLDIELVEVRNAGHGFKQVQGNDATPSMTWDEVQQLVVQQVLEWIRQTNA